MILSFYSYKGGVGRTQLVANVASYLCFYKHKRILLLEWDLEAPGLHFYFDKTNANIRQEGLIELLLRYNALAQKGEKYGEADLPYFTEEYIVRGLKTSGKNKGTIDLIPAAKYAEPFSQKINDFNWREFMELYDGKVYMDFLKKELKKLDYDYIFIDSRTGIADYSGLCNILMPDMNVIIVAPTEQNFEGAKKIANAIKEHPYTAGHFRKAAILPILSRIDSDAPQFVDWLSRFIDEFAPVLSALLPKNLNELQKEVFRDWYQPHTTLFYNRTLALGENILFGKEKQPIFEGTSAKVYENIALLIERVKENQVLDIYSQLNYQLLEKWLEDNKNDLHYYVRIAGIYTALGSLDKALALLKKGQAELNKNKKDDKELQAIFYERLGDVNSYLGKYEKSLEFFEECNKIRKDLHAASLDNVDFKKGLAISYSKLGETHSSLNSLDKALEFFEEYNRLSVALYADYPDNVDFKNGLAISYYKLGETHSSLGNLDKALEFFEENNRLSAALYADYPDNVDFKYGFAVSYQWLGIMHTSLGNLEKALGFLEKATKLFEALYADYPDNVGFKFDLAISYERHGSTLTSLGNFEKALEFFEKDYRLTAALFAAYPDNANFKLSWAISSLWLGITHSGLGNLGKALGFFEEDNQLSAALYTAYPDNVDFKNALAISYAKLGETFTGLDNFDKALEFFEKFHQLSKELYDRYPLYVVIKSNYAESLSLLFAIHKLIDNSHDTSKLTESIQLFEALYAHVKTEHYRKKLNICKKMKIANADLKGLITEMSAF